MTGLYQDFSMRFATVMRSLRCVVMRCTGLGVVRGVVVLVCVLLVGVGCSSGESAESKIVKGEDLVSPSNEETSHSSGLVSAEDWPRPPLAGMKVDHPEQLRPSVEAWIYATVSIEPPCVYLIDITDGERFGDDSASIGEVERLALSLVYPEVRFDENSQTLWNSLWGYDIPIVHGDRVIVGATVLLETFEGNKEPDDLHLFWDACAAHGVASPEELLVSVEWFCLNSPPEWVWHEGQERERICVEDTRPWNQRDWLKEQGIDVDVEQPVEGREFGEPPEVSDLLAPPFFGMHPYHPDMELEVAKLVGVLSIESVREYYERVCAYLYPTAASDSQNLLWGDLWKHTGPDGQPLAIRLDLPYPQVGFDEENWSLWNGGIGPMATGARVIVDPVSPPDFNDNYLDYGDHKQPHEIVIDHPCRKANASVTVLDIQPVEHYCANNPPVRHRSQCEHAMNPTTQTQNQLTPPEGQRHR